MNARHGVMALAQRTAREDLGEETDFRNDSVWSPADLLPSETGENDLKNQTFKASGNGPK